MNRRSCGSSLRILAAAGAQGGQREFGSHFLALGPVVIGVAFKAARFGVIGSRRVAGLASGNPRNQDVETILAGERFFVATLASEPAMRVMIELCMRHPARGSVGRNDVWQKIQRHHGGKNLASAAILHLALRRERGPAADVGILQRGVVYGVAETAFFPQQLFGDGSLLRDPLRGREYLRSWQVWLAGQFASRIANFTEFRGMRADVVLEFLHDKSVDDLRLVVGRAIVDVPAEFEFMARRASGGVFHGGHQLAASHGVVRGQKLAFHRQEFALRSVRHFGGDIFGVGVIPLRLDGRATMTIAADELNGCRIVGAASYGLHVQFVIELDRSGIARGITQRGELRVPVFKAVYMRLILRHALVGFQIGVALGAGLIVHRADVDVAAMFGVARSALRRSHLIAVMNGAVVAGLASAVRGFRGKRSRFLKVARGAFFFEHGVRGAHAAAGIDAIVAREGAPSDPRHSDHR